MRHVAPVRKALGVPTTFNFLGPLANPAQPVATSLGVANPQIAPLMASELAARGRNALVFRGLDGLDELTTTANSDIWLVQGGVVRNFELNPAKFGLKKVELADLLGGQAQQNAEVALRLLHEPKGSASQAIREVVALNAAGGLVAYELSKQTIDSQQDLDRQFELQLERAFEALDSGAAAQKLSAWMSASQA